MTDDEEKCEGCEAPATCHDTEGIPLCDECAKACEDDATPPTETVAAPAHAAVPCPKCRKLFNPYWSERLKRAAKVCASCAWRNLEAFLNEPDPEETVATNRGVAAGVDSRSSSGYAKERDSGTPLHPNVTEALEALARVAKSIDEMKMPFVAGAVRSSRRTLADHLRRASRCAPSHTDGDMARLPAQPPGEPLSPAKSD